jgi:hypothetical protein
MYTLSVPLPLTVAFTVLTLVVALAGVLLVRRAAPRGRARRWTVGAALASTAWLGLHAAIASSGLLEGDSVPPPVMLYLVPTLLTGVALAFSPVGRRLAALPIGFLVALQAFRLPLEWLLHALYEAGSLPVQMTWSGYNLDVLTGASAIGLGLLALRRPLPRSVAWGFNVVGSALLLTVMTIAVLSSPIPIRQFHEGPPVLLAYNAPFNWIVNVHVFTALVGHLVIFRALAAGRSTSGEESAPHQTEPRHTHASA